MTKQMMSILGIIVLLGSVGAVFGVPHLRFWAWQSDFQVVAGASYSSLLSIKLDRLADAEDRLASCIKQNNECSRERRSVKRLQQETKDIERDKKKYGN